MMMMKKSRMTQRSKTRPGLSGRSGWMWRHPERQTTGCHGDPIKQRANQKRTVKTPTGRCDVC